MHILVSFCNLRAPGVPALGLLDATTMDFRVLDLPAAVARSSGITGLAQCDRYLYVVAQPSESLRQEAALSSSVLFIFNCRDLSLANHYAFRSGADIHSILEKDGRLYAVSTGTDEIIELRLRGTDVVSETCFWRADRDGPREDLHHLNSIAWQEDSLLVAAFGLRISNRWNSARDGFITNVSTGETLAHGLDQPHSLLALSPAIACCESRKRAVRVIGDERVQHLPGYSRGICRANEHLFAATSIGRQRSRSLGVINNPAADGLPGGQCTINRLSMTTFQIDRTLDLGTHAQEIYELLLVTDVAGWPVVDEITWRSTSIRELATLLDDRTRWAKQSVAGINQREATIDELRQTLVLQVNRESDCRALNSSLQREIIELREINEQQSASLESLKFTVEELRKAATEADRRMNDGHADAEYCRQLSEIRQIAADTLPTKSRVAVVSKGDEEMLQAVGQHAWHFPQTLEGVYAGSHPVNSLAAIAQIEALRLKGVEFLLFPGTACWWLEHYQEFRGYLIRRYRDLTRHDACLIFDLRESPVSQAETGPTIEAIIDQCRRRLGSAPAILDWSSGLHLTRKLTGDVVFSPPTEESLLPYLEQSIDVVVIPQGSAAMDEARRVAGTAVVTVSPVDDGTSRAPQCNVEWHSEGPDEVTSAVSLICLTGDSDDQRLRWQSALQFSLPRDFTGDIVWAESPDVGDRPTLPHVLTSYTGACNIAATRARGDVLVFLNRLIPLEGWLAPLLDLLRARPRAGVVGARILTADARLDHGGGVAFSDGSLAGFGHGDYQIDDPLYGYVRKTDWCGDALLATRRVLFEELSGFDTAWRTPAYVNADFCFRARERGFDTYYQPGSVAVSITDATGPPASTDLTADFALDRKLFAARWKSALDKQPFARQWHDRDAWHALALCGEFAEEGCQ